MKELRERLETVPQRSRLYSRQRAMREDLRSAVRSLRKSPTPPCAVAVLALGIGAATALYSVVDAVVLRGLPFDEHDRVMAVLEYETTRQTMLWRWHHPHRPTSIGDSNSRPSTG